MTYDISPATRAAVQIAGWNVSYMIEWQPERGWHGCRMLDFSPAGAALEIYDMGADELQSGRVVVDLEVASRAGAGVQLRGVIRNTTPGPYGGTRVGLEFVGLDARELATIEDLLERQSA